MKNGEYIYRPTPYYEGPDISNQKSRKLGVFDRKLMGSNSIFHFYFDVHKRSEGRILDLVLFILSNE